MIVEPTSGNTGIALAFLRRARVSLILVMPDSMSMERRRMLKLLGAELELTPAAQGMRGAIAARRGIAEDPARCLHAAAIRQSRQPGRSTARPPPRRFWRDTDGKVDVVVSGVGTGGTLTGVGSVLKQRKPSFRMIAVEPEDSAVLSGGPPGPHKIQGIGAGFVPQILDTKLIDEVRAHLQRHAPSAWRAKSRGSKAWRSVFPPARRSRPALEIGAARRDGWQDHRRRSAARSRRALSLDRSVRGILIES